MNPKPNWVGGSPIGVRGRELATAALAEAEIKLDVLRSEEQAHHEARRDAALKREQAMAERRALKARGENKELVEDSHKMQLQ